jgi:hypothetical protein
MKLGGYDENLDAFTATQLYKTYGRPTLLYGVANLNLNSGEIDRLNITNQKNLEICAVSS